MDSIERPFILYGAGGHAAVVIDAASSAGWMPDVLVDDDKRITQCLGIQVRHLQDGFTLPSRFRFLVAIGDNASRARVFESLRDSGGEAIPVIHARAVVSSHVQVGAGTLICGGAVVNPRACIGLNCIVNTAASVDHDCIVGDHVHLCPGVRLGGTVRVAESAMLGLGSVVLPGLSVGAHTIVGAGSVVVRDLPPNVVAYGVPACVVRSL